MDSKKIIEITMIENTKKTKKKKTNFKDLKIELYDIIDNLIELDYENTNHSESLEYIKTNLPIFMKLYININRNIKNISMSNKIIKTLLNEMINDVIYRCEPLKDSSIIKNIDMIKKEKQEINTITMI